MYKMVLRHDVGSPAPGFILKDAAGRDVSLGSYRGRSNVVLVFFTGSHDSQAVRSLAELARSYDRVRAGEAEVVAITPEVPGKVRTLVEGLNPPFAVLSDPEQAVVKEYDVYDPSNNWTWPAAFIIDRDGVVQYAFRGASAPNTPPVEYILLKLALMKEGKAAPGPGVTRART
jgi:peroxiredoxin